MQDIDFDELDRAVNSLISPSDAIPEPVTPASSPAPEPIVIPSSSQPVETPMTTVAPSATTQRPSTGRFMDVVHPSSDMRSTTPAANRTVTTRPAPESLATPEPLSVLEIAAPTPELIEETGETVDTTPTPLETPFLSDPQVEKRPLGAFSDAAPQPPALDLSAELEAATIEEAIPEVETKPSFVATETTADVGATDMSSLEISEETLIGSKESSDTSPNGPMVAEEIPETTPEAELAPEPPIIRTVAPTASPAGPISIAQQYKEHPSTSDQASGAIYDTESYHQPLAHPPKTKSGVLIIIWILALVVVGAGVGAAIFFFVLPNLN